MFGQLVDSGRAIRLPLLTGYSILFSVWTLVFDDIPSKSQASRFSVSVVELIDGLGSTAKAALITFAALMIGSLVQTVLLDPLMERMLQRVGAPDWKLFVELAHRRTVQYEEHTFTTVPSASTSASSTKVPSASEARRLAAEADDRKRLEADAQFRLGASIVLLPPAILVGWLGERWWWLGIVFVIALFAHSVLIHSRTLRLMYLREKKPLTQEAAELERKVAGYEEELATPGSRYINNNTDENPEEHKERFEKLLERAKSQLTEKQAECAALTLNSFRRAQSRKSETVLCERCGNTHD